MTRPIPIHHRGYHAIYRREQTNFCPGCGRSHWIVGRISAECAFCETAILLEQPEGIAA